MPHEEHDDWTFSKKLQVDLTAFLREIRVEQEINCLEIGTYLGYTTLLLSEYCTKVVTIDRVETFLQFAQKFNTRRPNIDYLHMDTVTDSWEPLMKYEFHVVIFDGGMLDVIHSDFLKVFSLPVIPLFLIFPRYTQWNDMKDTVNFHEQQNLIRCTLTLGRGTVPGQPTTWINKAGHQQDGPEAKICTPLVGRQTKQEL